MIDHLGNQLRGALSDWSIEQALSLGELEILPFDCDNLGPSTYDLTVALAEPLWLAPFEFHLLSSSERIRMSSSLQGQVHGRSSIGRKGVLVHFTAGYIDPGFDGDITFEVMALHEPVLLKPGDRIAQVGFMWLDRPCRNPYGSGAGRLGRGRYQHQTGATASRFKHADEEMDGTER